MVCLAQWPKDRLNSFVFLLTIFPGKGKRLSHAPIHLGSLYYCLDECLDNIVRSVGRTNVTTTRTQVFFKPFHEKGLEPLHRNHMNVRLWKWWRRGSTGQD